MDAIKLKEILEKHKKWLLNEVGGERANLRYANLRYADLRYANLRNANLRNADLRNANLCYANLRNADLRYADLRNADLCYAEIEDKLIDKFFPICCPEVGSFIAWKKAHGLIVKLEVTESAKRGSAFGRKCRCSEAKVLAIECVDGTKSDVIEINSDHDPSFFYRIGEIVRVEDFDDNRRNECAAGIHFFITRQEAVDY